MSLSALLNFAAHHASNVSNVNVSNLDGKWRPECLDTKFSPPILLYAKKRDSHLHVYISILCNNVLAIMYLYQTVEYLFNTELI